MREVERIREALRNSNAEKIVAFVKKENEPREVLAVLSQEEIDRVTFSPLSVNNPAKLLMQLNGKIAVVAKGCDAMAIRQLIKEGKLKRENLFIVGISCKGVANYRKLSKIEKLSKIKEVYLEGDELVLKLENGEKRIPFIEVMEENCLYCRNPTPVIYDVLIGEPRNGITDFRDIEEMEKMSREERWNYWISQFERCIRCHACRSVCPLCYCEECMVDPSNLAISPMSTAEEKASYPRLLGKTVNAKDNAIYHIIRVLHHAGRCSGCGECERACPMELPLRKLERKLEKVVREIFGYDLNEDVPFFSKLDIVGD
uniref:4Fe-4S ferredoxin-type domain-containing protein n=1 Tax=Archaeoglobus fulgidus TaxID=2234 RepID=A0A7J2TI13_ARCFL